MGLLATIGAIVLYLMTNASTFLLYKQKYPREFKFVDHAFWPLLATIFFVPPLIVSLWPRSLDVIGMGFDNTYPVSLALPFTIAWAVIGTAFYLYLRVLRPHALANLATEMERVQLSARKTSRSATRGRPVVTDPEWHRKSRRMPMSSSWAGGRPAPPWPAGSWRVRPRRCSLLEAGPDYGPHAAGGGRQSRSTRARWR